MKRMDVYKVASEKGYGVRARRDEIDLIDLESGVSEALCRLVDAIWEPAVPTTFAQDFAKLLTSKLNRDARAIMRAEEKAKKEEVTHSVKKT